MRRDLRQSTPEKSLPDNLRFVQWTESLDNTLMDAFNDAFSWHWGLPKMDVDTQNPTGALRLYENLGFEAAKRTITFMKVVNSGGN